MLFCNAVCMRLLSLCRNVLDVGENHSVNVTEYSDYCCFNLQSLEVICCGKV
jgi:hypothetical protein